MISVVMKDKDGKVISASRLNNIDSVEILNKSGNLKVDVKNSELVRVSATSTNSGTSVSV